MISTTDEYKRQLINGNRNYVVKIPVFLAGNDTITPDFTLTNEEIWENGVTLTNSISSDNSFDIGSAIIGDLSLVLNNINEDFSGYDFVNARLTLWIGVTGDVDEYDDQVYYRIGFYVVDSTNYSGSLITLDCLDNMTWFDVPFSEVTGISYPITAGQLITAICSHVGVTLDSSPTFPNYNRTITAESGKWLTENNVNCREVLQYVAQKCCCYCKIDTAGQLVLAWYDKSLISSIVDYDGGTFNTNTTPYSDGDELDGGDFTFTDTEIIDGGSFTELKNRAWLSQNYSMNVSVEDIVITGCRVVSNTGEDSTQYDELYVDSTLEQTHERYVLTIENNPLIVASEAASIAASICNTIAGLKIRAFDSRSLNDISYETGDVVTIVDFRGIVYYTWITSFTFTINDAENFSCGVQSVRERSETRYSQSAKTLAEANKNASDILTAYDTAVKAMNQLAQSAIGYNKYQYTTGGATITWLYNGNQRTGTSSAPLFPDSTVVFKISGDGVFISNDGGTTYSQGYDANSGTAILSLIYAVGLNAEWINTGTLTVGGTSNTDGEIQVWNAAGTTRYGLWNKDGVEINQGVIKTTTTYTKSGVQYQRGLEISDGGIEYIPPTGSSAEAYIQMYSPTSSSQSGFDDGILHIYADSVQLHSAYNGYNNYVVVDADGVSIDGKAIKLKSLRNSNSYIEVENTTNGNITIQSQGRLSLYSSSQLRINGTNTLTGWIQYQRGSDYWNMYVENGLIVSNEQA